MSHVVHAGEVYCSNATQALRLVGSTSFPIALPTPAGRAFHNDGQLAGRRLSGIHELQEQLHRRRRRDFSSSSITLASVGGIVVTLPATTTGATRQRLSVSNERRRSLPAGVGGRGHGDLHGDSALATGEITGRFEMPLPAGTLFSHKRPAVQFFREYGLSRGCRIALDTAWRWTASCRFLPCVDCHFRAERHLCGRRQDLLDSRRGAVADVLPYGAVSGTAFSLPNLRRSGGSVLKGWLSRALREREDLDGFPSPYPRQTPAFLPCSTGNTKAVSCGWCVNLENGAATR